MHRTKEIRWFFRPGKQQIGEWFDGLPFDCEQNRTDFYLKQKSNEVGVKLRDGNIEIKNRIGNRATGSLGQNVWGYYYEFTKWSFNSAENNELFNGILNQDYDQWLAIKKHRKLAQLTKANGEIVVKSMSDDVPFGCQLEYTKLEVDGEPWFTFGLEWFGTEILVLDSAYLSEVLGDTKLSMGQSRSYAAFVKSLDKGRRQRKLKVKCYISN